MTAGTPGLLSDARIITRALARTGLKARTLRARIRNLDLRASSWLARVSRRTYAANIHLERIWPHWLDLGHPNFFIPNQEWCRPETVALLGSVDLVLCKTRYAEAIFKARGLRAHYIGFTSEDHRLESARMDRSRFLHLAGRSEQKGTRTLIEVWAAHPEWPVLTIVWSEGKQKAPSAPNIRLIDRIIGGQELTRLQNECGVHLCPSEAEGYGHYIVEAMSCGALVVTTDAPPMNEIVTPQRGFLAAYKSSKPQALGENYYVDPAALEAVIEKVLLLSETERAAIGRAARQWFVANQEDFERRLELTPVLGTA